MHADDLEGVAANLAVGTYNFGTLASAGKCLDVNGAGTADGTNVQEWTCNGTAAQAWRVEDLGGGVSRLVNPNSNKCLDVNGAGTADGTNIQLWACNGTAAQSFAIESLDGQDVRIRNTNSGSCVDVAGSGTADGTNVQLWTCNGTNAQSWRPTLIGGSTPPSQPPPPAQPPPPPPPTTATGLAAVLTQAEFDQMKGGGLAFYSYSAFVEAAAAFPTFAATGDLATRKREVAAFMGNAGHETVDFQFIDEVAMPQLCGGGACGCAPGQSYFGRGPLQLSWSFNYCAAGQALGLPLAADPGLAERDPVVSFKASIWFWMTSGGAGSGTCHDAIVSGLGFGETIRTINGALECNGGNPAEVQDRVNHYQRYIGILGIDAGGPLGC
jgi:chitinase